jgi:uncharacterized membrane protein
MRKMFLLLVLALLLGNLFAALSLSTYTVSPSTIRPGGQGILTLTVANTVTTGATNEKANAVELKLYPPPELQMRDSVSLGDLDLGTSGSTAIPFYVPSKAKSGIYVVEVRAISSAGSTFQTYSIPVTIVDSPILSLSTNKDTLQDITPLVLTIANEGGAASRVRVTSGSSSFALLGQSAAYTDSIAKSANLNLTLDARNADDGAQDVAFNITYQDDLGNEYSVLKNLRLTVKKERLDLNFNQKSDIFTKKDSDLKLEVRNNGKPLGDVRISFDSDSLKLQDTSEVKLGAIAANSVTTINLPVYSTSTPGTNYVDIVVKYVEEGVEKEQTISVPLTVTSDADVAVYLDAKPAPLAIGQEHTLSVLVSNLGSYEISNVDVAISSPVLESLDIHEKEYIGGLNKDDFSTVQFKVKVTNVAPGTYPLNVTVNYRDLSGDWKTKTINDKITIHQPVAQGNGSMPLLIGAIVVLAFLVYWFKLRKKPTSTAKRDN